MVHARRRARLAVLCLVPSLALVAGVVPAAAESTPAPPTSAPASTPTTSDESSDPEEAAVPAEPGTTEASEPGATIDDTEPTPQADEPPPTPDLVPTTVVLERAAGTTSPQEPARGTVRVTADGEPLAGARVTVVADGASDTSVDVTTGTSGAATYALSGLRAGTYRLRAELQETGTHAGSRSAEATVVVQAGRWVSLLVNNGFGTRVLTRENFWLRGRVLTTAGKPQPRVTVALYRYAGSGRTKVATVRTNAYGWFTWSPADRRAGTYRAQVSGTRYSAKQTVRIGTGERTLLSREASLAFLLGERRTGTHTGSGRSWRGYTKGVLVQSGGRTWVVRGRLTSELSARGGAGGSLGGPTGDVRCGLPEGGCLQQFRTGAIYTNSKAKDTLTSAVSSTLGAADLLAVARSQVGYREPSPRKSKYNKWVGRTGRYDPWCGFFVSWLAHAGGKPGSIIKATSYKKLLDAERKRGRTSQTAKVGRLAYIGYFSKGTPSHVGIVTKVSSSHVWTIEGNVSAGGGQKHPRGVHVVKRTKSRIVFYADPRY